MAGLLSRSSKSCDKFFFPLAQRFVAYTGNNMRKATPSPDPRDKSKEVRIRNTETQGFSSSLLRSSKLCVPSMAMYGAFAFFPYFQTNQ